MYTNLGSLTCVDAARTSGKREIAFPMHAVRHHAMHARAWSCRPAEVDAMGNISRRSSTSPKLTTLLTLLKLLVKRFSTSSFDQIFNLPIGLPNSRVFGTFTGCDNEI